MSDAVAMDAQKTAVGGPDGAPEYGQPELLNEIRSSWALIEPRAPEASAYFYEHFFTQNPRYRKLFTGDPAAQQRRLFQAVSRIIADFDDLDDFLPYLRRLALRHRKFGLRPAHYQAFGESMLATISRFTGPAWTDLTRQAWEAGYGLVASVMQEAAAEAEAQAPPYWEAEVVAHELLAEDVARIEVRVLQDPDRPGPYRYHAGQYASLEAANQPRVWRDFSFASMDTGENRIVLHIQAGRSGGVSDLLVRETAEGDRLRIAGAEGELGFAGTADTLVAVAHGTGAAPVSGLVEALIAGGDRRPLTVLLVTPDHGPGSAAEHYLAKHFEEQAARHGALEVLVVGESSLARTARAVLAPERPWQGAVLVGPSVLIDHCRAELLAAGTPAEAIATDQFD
ncbi:globin domain-containing protein [Actinospica sp.]|uniref:globin domain-containing protein n=1 Tax=Actinospica sp. TaxID=1872142 RepID=UPI002B761AFD|nr:globin domain-containing protein [Actinospica sp.]HWG23714.1 globin domain-containing protein [Actinospica sp.]